MNHVLQQIQRCMDERHWTLYKLSKESHIPYSSLNSLFQKGNQPTISTLEKICDGFGITLSEFFSYQPPYRHIPSLTSFEKNLLSESNKLNKKNQKLFLDFLKLLLSHQN